MPPHAHDEERPLLDQNSDTTSISSHHTQTSNKSSLVKFTDHDSDNPKAWSPKKKLTNVGIIALMAILSPLASSMFTPGIAQVAEDLNCSEKAVIATTTGFVIMLGLGPLLLAPFSETFGRRKLYIWCFAIFTVLQIPTALAPNVGVLIAARTISGFFGSVGIANGGGTISDMYEPSERASIFGWYLLGPLMGPTIGPLFGGLIITHLNWRWVYWILLIVCLINTTVGYLFLHETYAPVLLLRRRDALQAKNTNSHPEDGEASPKYHFEGEDTRSIWAKLRSSMKRPIAIFIQPIVLIMSLYQALIFGTTYSIYTNMQDIYSSPPYNFSSQQIGFLYLGPGLGFLVSVWFLVPRIDTIYNALTEKNHGKALPEFRLPLANIGAVLIPLSLFWFGWSVDARSPWPVSIAATFFYGLGQLLIFNTVQNYYIDSFEKYAASAIAGGSVFRSLIGGVVPLFAPALFERLGYGWGISVFGFLAVAIAPAPAVFYYFGGRLRERFPLKL
jgi:multidrug resistance protein